PGASTNYVITVSPLEGFTGEVIFAASSLPSGARLSFSPSSVFVSDSFSQSSTVTVSTSATTPAGTFPLTITGTSGELEHTPPVVLAFSRPNFDFTITASPTSQTVSAGSGASYTITISPLEGFTGEVTLSASGTPGDTSLSFSPPSIMI